MLSSSALGTRNASVFPLPVLAAPKTSFPASRGGIVLAWTSVIVSKPIRCIAAAVGGERERDKKFTGSNVAGGGVGGMGARSRESGAGESRVTFEELGWDGSSCPLTAGDTLTVSVSV